MSRGAAGAGTAPGLGTGDLGEGRAREGLAVQSLMSEIQFPFILISFPRISSSQPAKPGSPCGRLRTSGIVAGGEGKLGIAWAKGLLH